MFFSEQVDEASESWEAEIFRIALHVKHEVFAFYHSGVS